jgi:uncharacterized membrane protein YkvA (DUF1232 family)
MMLGAFVYMISPIDLIPDLLVGPGLLDDVLVVPGLLLMAVKAIFDASNKQPATARVHRTNHNDAH